MYDFFIKNGFVFEMFICNAMFAFNLPKRKNFAVRLILCFVGYFLYSVAWSFFETRYTVFDLIKYITMFILAAVSLMICFKVNVWMALFYETGAAATQHSAYKVGEIVQYLLAGKINIIAFSAIYVSVIGVCYLLFYLIFARRLKDFEASFLDNKKVVMLSVGLLMCTAMIGQHFYIDAFAFYAIVAFYDIMCCILALTTLFDIFVTAQKQQQLQLMDHILYMQKQQFKMSKESIDIINIKCHDLKHQILTVGDRITDEELSAITEAIDIYDSSIKTGNDVLDVILTEKSLMCKKNNIKLNCIADGSILQFMRTADLYSLFGNAIENALTAVMQLQDEDARVVSVSVKSNMGMVSIHIENAFDGSVDFYDGLPVTTKKDKRYHGFGMKSIKMVSDKYNGVLSVSAQNNVFSLNILIPMKERAEKV